MLTVAITCCFSCACYRWCDDSIYFLTTMADAFVVALLFYVLTVTVIDGNSASGGIVSSACF